VSGAGLPCSIMPTGGDLGGVEDELYGGTPGRLPER
jgi:hypothetical protein